MQIPRTIADAVQHRVAGITPAARSLLTTAAVAGHRFDFDLLQKVTKFPEASVLASIKELIAAQLVIEYEADHFAFRHALTRAAIYASLLGRERITLHRAILSALEEEDGASASFTAELALHAHAGQQWEKSLRYGRRAGEQAVALHAPRPAVEHLSRAIEAADHLPDYPGGDKAALFQQRADSYATLSEFDLARADYETALDLARLGADAGISAPASGRAEWESLFGLGFLWTARNMEPAGLYLDQALAVARQLDEPALLGASLNRIGNWRLNMEQPMAALALHNEALAIFTELGDAAGLALTHDLLGISHAVSCDYPAGVPHHNQAAALYRELNDLKSLSSCLGSAALRGGGYQGDIGVFAEASVAECRNLGQEAIHLARQIGWGFGEANANVFLALAMGIRGEYRAALTCARDGIDLALDVDAPVWQGVAHIAFGRTHHDCCDLPAARCILSRR
ncbi:MAG: hypothetical protein HC802_04730 [Caldilineaceae bacterium]|nr:hypothetical protein [Caldilineaceae bacterium]